MAFTLQFPAAWGYGGLGLICRRDASKTVNPKDLLDEMDVRCRSYYPTKKVIH